MRPRSLRTQITVSVAALMMVVVALTGALIILRIDHRDREDVDRQLAVRADKARMDVSDRKFPVDDVGGDPTGGDDYGGLLAGSQSLVRVLLGDRVVEARGERPAEPVPAPVDGLTTVELDGQEWRSLVVAVTGRDVDRLQVLQSLAPVDDRLADNIRIVALVALLATVVTAIGVSIVAGWVLTPLQRLRSAAVRIRPDDLEERLPAVTRPQEVADLTATLNHMLERLQSSMLATRRFTADAGHELRTPLTGLGVDLETLLRNPDLPAAQRQDVLAAMAVEHRRIVALLTGLQTLARGDAGALPVRASVDLVDLVGESVDRARRQHRTTTFRLTTHPHEPVPVAGWREGLRLAIDNLLANAALHGRASGTVEVAVDEDLVGPTGAQVRVTISDDGPGIPESEREAMKGRFARGADTRSEGSGLGLALVEQQAHLHSGAMELGRGPAGGLQVTLTFPAGAPPDPHAAGGRQPDRVAG